MLRQIARLGRSIPAAGGRGLAIAVYADALDQPMRAHDAGYEGVACVDDAARALDLYCDLWEATSLPWVMRWCEGLLEFILAMQDQDGRWVNFILDWDGTPNRTGRTSVAGGAFWQARALLAVARASRHIADQRIDSAVQRGLRHVVDARDIPPDVRTLHILTALELLNRQNDKKLRGLLATWSAELLECRIGDVLMNASDERGLPHLWGHIQEAVLADVAARLGRGDLLDAACRSALAIFPAVVATGFDRPRMQPYDVASAVHVLARLAEVTGRPEYALLAADARAWFDGRNPSGRAVYDRDAGRIADGVDGGCLNDHSGAESNIVGAQALFEDAVVLALGLPASEALPAALN